MGSPAADEVETKREAEASPVEFSSPVLGLNENFVLVTLAGKLPVFAVTQRGNMVALVVVSFVMPMFVALVAVPVNAPTKDVAVSAPVPELKVSSEESLRMPDAPAKVTRPATSVESVRLDDTIDVATIELSERFVVVSVFVPVLNLRLGASTYLLYVPLRTGMAVSV